MTQHNPDSWVIVKFEPQDDDVFVDVHFRVLAGWSGGYLGGDSWRINSGITSVELDGEFYVFSGISGSTYQCHRSSETMCGAMRGAWSDIKNALGPRVNIVPVKEVLRE